MGPKNAFTLIELLVAIAIIALLIGLLLPVLGSARETGRSAVCLVNQRSIAQAGLMYAKDNDGIWVGFVPGTDRKLLLNYYLNQSERNAEFRAVDVWNCPSNLNAEEAAGVAREASYGFNVNLNRRRIFNVQSPSATVGLADGGIDDRGNAQTATHLWPPSRLGSARMNECRPNPRHTGQVNAAWMDGHVDTNPIEEPFYPGPPTVWTGNGVTDRNDPDYKDQQWDLF